MTDGSVTTGWTFDNANRCTQIAQPNGTVTYGFDNANRRTSMAISGTGTWSYSFDAGNRLTSTTNPNSETTSLTLDAAGRITRQDFSNTTYALNSYDSANRITEIQTKNSGATVLSDIQYAYDGVNVTSRTDTPESHPRLASIDLIVLDGALHQYSITHRPFAEPPTTVPALPH